jgi:hypothetical protein
VLLDLAVLWGVFVGWSDIDGVGIVLPIENIREAVNIEELRVLRAERDGEALRNGAAASASTSEAMSSGDTNELVLPDVDFDGVVRALLESRSPAEGE